MTTPSAATSSKNWKKRVGGTALPLPSGNTCLVKRPGMDALLKAGIMPDSLTPIAMEAIKKAESGGRPMNPEKEDSDMEAAILEKVMQDPQEMSNIFLSFDKATAMCVVEPKVVLHMRQIVRDGVFVTDDKGKPALEEIPEDERISDEVSPTLDDGSPNPLYSPDPPLYTDEIDHEDKQHIFQFVVGGSNDLEPFRGQHSADVAGA